MNILDPDTLVTQVATQQWIATPHPCTCYDRENKGILGYVCKIS